MRRLLPWAALLTLLRIAPAWADPPGTFHVVPFALPAYQPETSWLVGGAVSLVYQPAKESGQRESQLLLAATASVRGQFSVLLQPDVYLLEDRLNLAAVVSAARFPDVFHGLGVDTLQEDAEAYTPTLYEVELSPKWRIAPSLYLGPSARLQRVRILESTQGGALERGAVEGAGGGTTVQLGVTAFWDTRDNTLNPRSGMLVRASLRTAQPGLGSSFAFGLLKLDGRGYWTLPWAERHVLALQALIELRRGEPPFYDTGRLGGSELSRGHYEGRFRERQHLATQVEYRAPLVWRFGGVAFASAATVARSLGSLEARALKPAGGLGLRFAPVDDVPVNVRLDVAYGSELSFYLNLGEAF